MDAETLEALKGSIAKWEGIVAGTGVDEGAANCPLCQMFLPTCCRGCPVNNAAKNTSCKGTPYVDYSDAGELLFTLGEAAEDSDRARLKTAAQAELDFLKSLLPVTP